MPSTGPRPGSAGRDYSALSVEEMEALLSARKAGTRAPLSARAVLEENKVEAYKRAQAKAQGKAAARIEDAEMLQQESALMLRDVNSDRDRRVHAQALANQYREEISARERARRAPAGAPDPEFFPFTGGEQLERQRRELAKHHMVDLIDAMERTRSKPVRRPDDPLLPRPQRMYGDADPSTAAPAKVSSFNTDYPQFLKHTRTYLTKMVDPEVQRQAMQQKVAATYEQLQKAWDERRADEEERAVGLHLNDHLRQQDQEGRGARHKENAAALKAQMAEAQARRKEEEAHLRAGAPGHFGPIDRKNKVVQGLRLQNAKELEAQIAAKRNRERDIRDYEMAQDRLYAENQVQDLVDERQSAVRKHHRQRELLRNSWAQQVKMRAVKQIVQSV